MARFGRTAGIAAAVVAAIAAPVSPAWADGRAPERRVPAHELVALETKAETHGLRALPPRHDPPLPQPPGADTLGCGAPCTAGTLEADHPFYDVFLNCANGAFTARTGASHPVTLMSGARQNVIYGGAGGGTGTSDISFRIHELGQTYLDPPGGSACLFDPPDTVVEPNSVGIEAEWIMEPTAGLHLVFREEIVAFGTTAADSGVRLTLGVTNLPSSTLTTNVGVRWQIDYQNASDDGPLFATVTCDPPGVDPELFTEHELTPAEIKDFYRIQNNAGTPIFSNVTSTTAITGIPNTGRPDRLVFGAWPSLNGSAWGYVTNEGNPGVDSDSAVLYYYGYLPADGFTLAPGESMTRSAVIFTTGELVDCGDFVPGCASSIVAVPSDVSLCAGQSTDLDASGITLTDCMGVVEYTWRDDLGDVVGTGPIVNVSPTGTTTYSVTVSCSADADCLYVHEVTVEVQEPPLPGDVTVFDPDKCNASLEITWEPATFFGPGGSGVYNVYRSEVGCADALARPPVAVGLTGTRWVDATTVPGVTYTYVVQAEDDRMPTACVPQGPANGGTVASTCATAVADQSGVTVPGPVGPVLRMRHAGQEVTALWPGVRPLEIGEHFHLTKALDVPWGPFRHVNGEGDFGTFFVETDTSSPWQFFKLRVADACERLSLDESP